LRVTGTVGLLVLLSVGWLAYRGFQAVGALQDTRTAAASLERGLLAGTASQSQLVAAQRASDRAASAVADPVWRAAEVVPWAGRQLRAVRVVAQSLDSTTHEVLPPVLSLVGSVTDGSIRTADGGLDVTAIAAAAPGLDQADAAAQRAEAQLAALEPDGLLSQLAGPVRAAQGQLSSLAGTVHTARTAVDLAPSVLGAAGPRTYLVAALNNAELRTAGGIVGAVIAVHVDKGEVSLGAQLSTRDLGVLADPVLPLAADELALEGDRLGRWVQDASMTPDFPRTGALIAARWVAAEGGTVDGVVALDVPAVATLLTATGPVTTSSGETLTASSFVRAVLRDPYLGDAAPAAVDRLFADVAGSVFRGVLSGTDRPKALLAAVRKIVAAQRLRVWSAHPDEQATFLATSIGAAFLTGSDAKAVGVFLNDGSGGKLDYYLTTSTTVVDASCGGARPAATVRLNLTYKPPAGVASSSIYLRGPGVPGVAPGDVVTSITFYAGVGEQVGPITLDGQPVGGKLVQRGGRGSVTLTSVLAPGQSVAYDVEVRLPVDGLTVWTTPTLGQGGLVEHICGAPAAIG
jgi:hypothetical protein